LRAAKELQNRAIIVAAAVKGIEAFVRSFGWMTSHQVQNANVQYQPALNNDTRTLSENEEYSEH
jgi:hypothetical protein